MPFRRSGKLKRKLAELKRQDFTTFMKIGGNVVVQKIVSNINAQKEINESAPLKRNSIDWQIKKGHGLSLIHKGLLRKKSTYLINAQKNSVRITRKPERKEIGKFVIDKGYHFWGISPSAISMIKQRWIKEIKSWLQ